MDQLGGPGLHPGLQLVLVVGLQSLHQLLGQTAKHLLFQVHHPNLNTFYLVVYVQGNWTLKGHLLALRRHHTYYVLGVSHNSRNGLKALHYVFLDRYDVTRVRKHRDELFVR